MPSSFSLRVPITSYDGCDSAGFRTPLVEVERCFDSPDSVHRLGFLFNSRRPCSAAERCAYYYIYYRSGADAHANRIVDRSLGEFETGAMNRAIRILTMIGLGLTCLYVDRTRRRQLLQFCDAVAASQQLLRSIVEHMSGVGIVSCNLRGRAAEWNHDPQLLTGYASDHMKRQSLFRVFRAKMSPIARGGQICHWARHKSDVVREKILRRRDGSRCVMHMMIRPAKNRFRRHRGSSLVRCTHELRSVVEGSSLESRPVISVLRDNKDVVLYRCRFEPRRTLSYIDAKIAQLLDDSGNGFPSMYNQALDDWMHPLDRQRVWNTIEEAVKAQRSYMLVYRLIGTVGKVKWIWDEGEAFITDDGHSVGLEGFLTGI
jgi:PAS domain S-box-containing protein